jgi:hypothetical protein
MRTTVTKEYLEKRIKHVSYSIPSDSTVTVCLILVDNGYSVIGSSACCSPDNFDTVIGREKAYEDALRQLYALEGYLLSEELSKQ